jgi:hypothetical protein
VFLTELSSPEFMKLRVIQVSSRLVRETRANFPCEKSPPEEKTFWHSVVWCTRYEKILKKFSRSKIFGGVAEKILYSENSNPN